MKKIIVLIGAFIFCSNILLGQSEVKIGSWTNGSFTYDLPEGIEEDIETILEDSLGIFGDLDSIRISDPDPQSIESIPYVIYYVYGENSSTSFGHLIEKRVNEENGEIIDYYITTNITEEEHEEERAAAWKCTTTAGCNGCKPHRAGFLGLGGVDSCTCTNNDEKYCVFERTGGGAFPWGPIIGAIGAIIAVLL
ncbi:MAG: hypothetical protein JNN00_07475 [Chitinophagaceae bacterium]|nr:hypothetical protein [Chitinophagaceae bacterium]